MKRFRSIFALSFILALFFALSGKTVHIFLEHGHDHEFVCTEKSIHIHEKEHSCFICEFDLQLGDTPGFCTFSQPFEMPVQPVPAISSSFVSSISLFNTSLRGPPAV